MEEVARSTGIRGRPWVVRLAVVNHTDGAPSAVQLSRLNIVCRRNSGRTLAVAG